MTNARIKSSPFKALRHNSGPRWSWGTESVGTITNLRRPRPTSPLYKDNSDKEADSPHYQTGVQRGQTRQKIKELLDIRTINELVQRRIQEVKLQSRSGMTLTVSKDSDFPISKKILECEFPKKF